MTRSRLILLPTGIFFGAVLALGINAVAEDSELDSGARVFPYNGVLEFNGEALNGNVDLMFALTDNADCTFEEEHGDVPVFSGRFTTNIGSVAGDVPTCVFDADEIYIGVSVRAADEEGEYTALVGQQRIHPVPFAYWAAEGADFRIDGAANIGGNLSVAGTSVFDGNLSDSNSALTVDDSFIVTGTSNLRGNISNSTGDVTIADHLDITGNLQDSDSSSLTIDDGLIVTGTSNFQGDISNSTGNVTITDNLRITGNIADDGSDVVINDSLDVRGRLYDNASDLIIDDNVTVNDNLTVSGDITLSGSLTADYLVTDQTTEFDIPRVEGFDNSPIEEELASTSTHFCALTRVRIGDDNDEDDSTMCEIVAVDGSWILRGQSSANEATSQCAATCFKFR